MNIADVLFKDGGLRMGAATQCLNEMADPALLAKYHEENKKREEEFSRRLKVQAVVELAERIMLGFEISPETAFSTAICFFALAERYRDEAFKEE
jgi:hypothetical protein